MEANFFIAPHVVSFPTRGSGGGWIFFVFQEERHADEARDVITVIALLFSGDAMRWVKLVRPCSARRKFFVLIYKMACCARN